MKREDVVRQYIYSLLDHNEQVAKLQDLYGEMIPTDFNEKCKLCPIWEECYAPVSGVGNVDSDIVFVGRNPGRDEDSKGIPFVGMGGQLLDHFIDWVGLDRDNLYITNLVKCFTEDNRVPTRQEINVCMMRWLQAELKILSPRLVVLLGNEASTWMSGHPLREMRLKMKQYPEGSENLTGVNVVCCTHPGAALRPGRGYSDFRTDAAFLKIKCKELGLI